MEKFSRHVDVNLSPYDPGIPSPEARYGLPREVQFCKRCVISNQRPNAAPSEFDLETESRKAAIHFDEEGVCDACRVWEDKHENIDWADRERELRDLCDRHRRNDGCYDCIVPGSGGKDSFVQAHALKHQFGMHPLTITWAPHVYTDWGWKNLQAWIHAGFDNILVTPNGRIHRLLTRLAFETMFHPFQPFVFGQKVLPARFSVQYDIPLVFLGDHGSEWGLPRKMAKDPLQRPENYIMKPGDEIRLGGVSMSDLKDDFNLTDNDLQIYMPVEQEEVERVGTQVHQLGYYLKWHPQGNYYSAVEHGFRPSPERTPGTYSKYSSIDDKIDDFNFYTYYVKFGIGRATYDAAQEIRARDITREEGVALVRRFDGEFPKRFADEVFEYLSLPTEEIPEISGMFEQSTMDRAYFDHLVDRFRSPHLWRYENGAWALRHAVWHEEVVPTARRTG